ncbi:MAG: hypothetical protein ACLP9L_23430 [Thermoguttaceae bacterium]
MSRNPPTLREAIQPRRRGLAMLELTMALPILLFIMALIINYGTIAAWKVRENSVARLEVWETRWPRSGSTDPRPGYWPATASMESSDQGTVAGMDDSRVDLPVARGPMPQATVNSNLLDPTRGLREGSAGLTRKCPLLGKLSYSITAKTWLVDDKWQYQRMGMGSNWQLRVPVLYALAEAPASLVNSYVQSVLAIAQAPFLAQLAPLDHDPDFIYYGALFGWGGAPNFYREWAYLQRMCTTDHRLTDPAVNSLIDRIQGNRTKRPRVASLAEHMAKQFLGLYERALRAFQASLNANPPAPPQMIALAQSQIPELQTKIEELKNFLHTIQASSGR